MGAVTRYMILILLVISVADGRILTLNSSNDDLISDGINDRDSSVTQNLSSCRHQYGFLPCAENAAGYIFMIVVYQVLLIVGDKLIGSGSDVFFYVTGPRIGGIIFRILRALPSMMLMIISGVLGDKTNAQAQVSVVVGVYAGITVFSLTAQWFMTLVSASKSLSKGADEDEESSDSIYCFPKKLNLRSLIENGVNVDDDTCRTAKIMLLSLIPYVVLQLVYAFDSSSGKRIITLIALVVSSLSLIAYFAYQIKDPWMQKRSLNYSKFDSVQRGLIQHVEGLGKLVNEDGTPNTLLIKSFFDKADKDDDQCIEEDELEKMVRKVFQAGKVDIGQNDAMSNVLNKLDRNRDKKITEDEFVDGFKQWIDEAKNPASDDDFDAKEMFHKASQLLKERKENNSSDIDRIMAKILKQAEGQLMKSEKLITDNGEPNVERIKCLFREFDTNEDGTLTAPEVKQLIGRVKFGTYQMKDEDVIKEMFKVFDQDGNEAIDEKEFIKGVQAYLDKAMKAVGKSGKTRALEEFEKIVWKEEEYGIYGVLKSVFRVLLGIAMLTFLAGPLMSTILELSNAMSLPSFVVSFVVVPLAMNGRAAIAAVLPSTRNRKSSLTFSEIYGGVIMNNMSGLTTLLAIVYAKELTWDFSAEVLTIMVVCFLVGMHAFLNKTYYLWTCIPALLLYPFSLGLFYFCQVFLSWN
ncbi:sodium/calcium exchanger NCL-like [Salvia miltiorrhiza]|uniref:sodium/calcium exchanger NCL-like n=1 Tax=Salvia miltiorrhiza TaxID=226208 RepID=UPI0025AD5D36|nr:sodium/calcium exchanger NCL-like [Salvia miltiorrhiza]